MHRTIMIATAGAFGLLALSMPAAAQYGGAPQSPPPEAPHANRQAAAPAAAAAVAATPAEVLAAAACAIGRDAHVGDALLASVPRSPEERTAARGFLRVAERCVRSTSGIATSAMTLRGAVAETLYETQFATAPAARAPVLEAKPLVRPAAVEDPAVAELATSYALVDCTAPKRPDLVRALLATEPRTEAEIAAINALNPAFLTCVARGARVGIEPRSIRSMFAEALYHWALVQRDGPASPWAAAPPAPPATQ